LRGGAGPPPVANRLAITVSIMLATIMQAVDTTIANVALPHIQGSLSATQDQISWVLTSYIVAAAIMTPLTGWLAGHFGIKRVFLISVVGFTVASALCGIATTLGEMVAYRLLQGVCGAALVPLSQAVLLRIVDVRLGRATDSERVHDGADAEGEVHASRPDEELAVGAEDDSERAVRTALAIQEAVSAYASEVNEAYGIELAARVAVNTGPAVVSRDDAPDHERYNALGDTVNVAARLQELAGRGGIAVGAQTARQVEDAFELEALGPVSL